MDPKPIGSTFWSELVAAGVTDWRFSWSADGTITFSPEMQSEDSAQCDLVLAVYAAHDPLSSAKADRKAVLAAACGAAITAGVSSSALGAPHFYPTTLEQQANMTASVVDSMLNGSAPGWSTPFLCQDGDGVWARREHTLAQIQAAGADLKAAIVASLRRLDTLSAAVDAATTADAVAAIVW